MEYKSKNLENQQSVQSKKEFTNFTNLTNLKDPSHRTLHKFERPHPRLYKYNTARNHILYATHNGQPALFVSSPARPNFRDIPQLEAEKHVHFARNSTAKGKSHAINKLLSPKHVACPETPPFSSSILLIHKANTPVTENRTRPNKGNQHCPTVHN